LPITIKTAALSWNADSEPYSDTFQDRYFSSDDGLAESRYVFIEKNNLSQRWLECQSVSYVIAETGFGSGLNFLAVCQAFEQFCQQHPTACLKRLYFISFEKYPLTAHDLKSAHQRWPQLSNFSSQLQTNYPSAIAGCHRLQFKMSHAATAQYHQNAITARPQVILDLWLGDISDTLPQLSYPQQGLIDCWLLDGFDPKKNPAMWNDTLYQNIAKVTKDQATLATFTAAGIVRRGLESAGFTITKVKGFGKKREMVTATFNRTKLTSSTASWFNRPVADKLNEVTIIGGGIASAALCLSLAQRGIKVTLLCKDPQLAQGASGNRQGGFYPLINVQHDYLSQLYSQAFFYSRQTIKRLESTKDQVTSDFCGVLQLAYQTNLHTRYQAISDSGLFPPDFLQWLTPAQATDLAKVEILHNALYFPQGGWLAPATLTQVLINHAKTLNLIEVIYDVKVHALKLKQELKQEHNQKQWQLEFRDGSKRQAHHVILANGHHLTDFEQTRELPLYQTSGQISHIKSTSQLQPLTTVLCYQGYLTPARQGQHCLGASFERDKTSVQLTATEHHQNIEKLRHCTQGAQWPASIAGDVLAGKVGVRLSAKDHLPMVGGVPDVKLTSDYYHDLARGKPASKYPPAPHHQNLYMLGALGSRGLCSAPLLAEILACQLTGEPQPVSQALLDQLNPNRYWIKQLKRGKSIIS